MVRRIIFIFIFILTAAVFCDPAYSQDDLQIWKEFTNTVRDGKMTTDKIRPYEQLGDNFKPVLLGFIDSLRATASPEDWSAEPEVIRVDNSIHYITPWTTGNERVSYCFSFITEGGQWYFQHLEGINIRLDKISRLPTSTFPDISENQKNWAREEIYWSFFINEFFLPIVKEKGKGYALDRVKDGAGYFLAARAWVPLLSPHKAFILYLCWEQTNLRGNTATLEKLEDSESVVRLETIFFALYSHTAQFKPNISLEEYKQVFETIWQDRALNAGWSLDIQYNKDYEVTFHFKMNADKDVKS